MASYTLANKHHPCLDVKDVVALEQKIAAEGTPLSELMRRAGTALGECTADVAKGGKRVLIVCGSGNNGGDGWVAARILAQRGFEVRLATPRAVEDIHAEPAHSAAVQTTEEVGNSIEVFVGDAVVPELFEGNDVIVDCILGTGFNAGDVKEPYASWIRWANAASAFKLACDVPSGMSAQTGETADPCFEADTTLTMLAVKPGLVAKGVWGHTGMVCIALLEE